MQPIETERLMLRPLEAGDEDAAFGLLSDPAVMRYSLNGPHRSQKDTADFIQTNINRQDRIGYSVWAILDKESSNLIGICGLAEFGHGIGATELAYRLCKDRWGAGYASEAGQATVEFAFTVPRLHTLIGAVEPANVASVRVLEKCGFTRASRRTIARRDVFIYELNRNDWLHSQF